MGIEPKAAAGSRSEARARVELQREIIQKEQEAKLARKKFEAQTAATEAQIERDSPKKVPAEKPRNLSPYVWLGGFVGALGITAIVAVNAMNDMVASNSEAQASDQITEMTTAGNVGVDQVLVETGSSDGSFFMFAMGGIVAIVVGVITAFKARSIDRPDGEAEETVESKTATSYQSQWDSLSARRNALMVQWSRYETDVALMIDYPIMTDYTDPVIAKVIAAMQQMRSAELLAVDEVTTPVYGSKMLSAVDAFEATLTAAEKYARRYGQTKLDPREQRKLSAARSALNIILNEQSPAHEVEAAYKSLRSSLAGIIELPVQAVRVLEAKTRRELTAA